MAGVNARDGGLAHEAHTVECGTLTSRVLIFCEKKRKEKPTT